MGLFISANFSSFPKCLGMLGMLIPWSIQTVSVEKHLNKAMVTKKNKYNS